MVSGIQPNPMPATLEAGGVNALPKADAAVQSLQETANVTHLTPLPKADIHVDPEKVRQNLELAIDHLNKMMSDANRGLSFSMDQQLGMPVVVVTNSQTGEVVRQIPNEVVVRVAHNLEAFKGMLHNAVV
jgi:flagellar protein FlaG